jgi:hypothetical protein
MMSKVLLPIVKFPAPCSSTLEKSRLPIELPQLSARTVASLVDCTDIEVLPVVFSCRQTIVTSAAKAAVAMKAKIVDRIMDRMMAKEILEA